MTLYGLDRLYRKGGPALLFWIDIWYMIYVIINYAGYDIWYLLTSVKSCFMHYVTTKHLPYHYLPNNDPTTQPQCSWNSSWFDRLWEKLTWSEPVGFREGQFLEYTSTTFKFEPRPRCQHFPKKTHQPTTWGCRKKQFPSVTRSPYQAMGRTSVLAGEPRSSTRVVASLLHNGAWIWKQGWYVPTLQKTDSWNPKRQIGCSTIFLLQGQSYPFRAGGYGNICIICGD